MTPDINLFNYLDGGDILGMVISIVAAMFVGFLWFGPVFGNAWAKEMGMDASEGMEGGQMGKSLALFALGNVFMVFVFWHGLHVYLPSLWADHFGVPGIQDSSISVYALNGAAWTWLGFFVPVQLSRIAWERSSFKLFAINSGYDLVRLLMFAYLLLLLGGGV